MSAIDLKTRFRLHSLEDVAAIFPQSGASSKAHIAAVKAIAERAGAYRLFGDVMLFTDSDIRTLIDSISNRGAPKLEPLDSQYGHMVVIGERIPGTDSAVFLGWAPYGGVQKLVDNVRELTPESVDFLDGLLCSYAEYKRHLEALAKYRMRGFWYNRTDRLNDYLRGALAAQSNESEDEATEPESEADNG